MNSTFFFFQIFGRNILTDGGGVSKQKENTNCSELNKICADV